MRRKDWASRLAALVAERRRMPFAWGVHDCCLWSADAVLAVTGVDQAATWRGTYSDAHGAMRVLRAIGGVEAAGARAGEEIGPITATLGDIGMVAAGAEDGSMSLGVCGGDCWLVVGEEGLLRFGLERAHRAWRVA